MAQDNTITFKIGNENKPVVENKDFENSIFSKQYRTAVNIVSHYFDSVVQDDGDRSDSGFNTGYPDNERRHDDADGNLDNAAFQGLAFCGERGDGKTSAMLSFINILRDANEFKVSNGRRCGDGVEFIWSVLGKENPILSRSTVILRPIDPTRFVNYNILEVIVSEIYEKVNMMRRTDKERGRELYRYDGIYLLFQSVKQSIRLLNKKEESLFDVLEDLEDLSDIIKLKYNLHRLFRAYLGLHRASRLIIPIDDMDLKLKGTFDLTERLRKYLAMPEVIVLMSVKPDQLLSGVEHALKLSVANDSSSFPQEEITHMAEKYLIKLLPQGCRVQMLGTEGLFERRFRVVNRRDERIYSNRTLKDGVLELIFLKTRYLFYNSQGEVSTLFPDNLRELFHLIAMVAEMKIPERNGDQTHRANQLQFKNYFFGVWTESLYQEDQLKVHEWISSSLDYTLNKDVVFYLNDKLNYYIERNGLLNSTDEIEESKLDKRLKAVSVLLRNSITNPLDYTYNVSLGDVFFILDIIEREVLPDRDYRLIFFIRSLYSIKLYDKYDYITHNHLVYPPGGNSGEIYRNDERFKNVNVLQRLVGGSYFTFIPKQLIATKDEPLDRRVIRGRGGLNDLINDIVAGKLTDTLYLKMAEFFILCVSHSVSSKGNMTSAGWEFPVKYMVEARLESDPIAFSRFSNQRGYYEFNVLAPFANMVNIRYAYERFNNGNRLFEMALDKPDSLLRTMLDQVYEDRDVTDGNRHVRISINPEMSGQSIEAKIRMLDRPFHSLYSGSIIRNSEILIALSDYFKFIRDKISREGADKGIPDSLPHARMAQAVSKLQRFFTEINENTSSMTTHRFEIPKDDSHSGVRHKISFRFCSVLAQFLEALVTSASGPDPDAFNKFCDIYYWKKTDNGYSPEIVSNGIEPANQNPDFFSYILRDVFRLIGFEHKGQVMSFDELFAWLVFTDIENVDSQQKCKNYMEAVKSFLTPPRFKDKAGQAAWLERVHNYPEIWAPFLENSYFQDQFIENMAKKGIL